ncbi:hypothetical protein M1N69_05545, partial [Thermodesulfovibrionales bacterium]|nr:hypothetical protein [Thermodesulfovibrionales bacterium]
NTKQKPKKLPLPRGERVGVRVNIVLLQPLTSPSPLSPPIRGREIRLFTRSSNIIIGVIKYKKA